MTLATTISDCLDAVTWSNPNHNAVTIYFGSLLGKYTRSTYATELDYQNDLGTMAAYLTAAELHNGCYSRGFECIALATEVKRTLAGVTMLGHLPHNYSTGGKNYFHVDRNGYGTMFRYARDFNYAITKWDSSFAWQEYEVGCLAGGNHGIQAYNPSTGDKIDGDNTFYGENGQSLKFLLELYELDKTNNADALTYARNTLWTYLNNIHYSEGHYDYRPDQTGYHCQGAVFPILIGTLRALSDYSLDNWDRMLLDVKTRFLTDEWDAPQWTYGTTKYYATVTHHDNTETRRLDTTLDAWIMLHAFYQVLDSVSQTHMRNLLDGSTKAWEYLLSNSGLYDAGTKQFKVDSGSSVSDYATAWGITCLFFMGIIPETGSLYVPLGEFSQNWIGLNRYFLFDYTNGKIRIPVTAGSLKFIYGSDSVTADFPEDAVYEITFSSDWNLISKIVKISNLDPNLHYVAKIEQETEGGQLYRQIQAIARRYGETVTRRALVLGLRDSQTGWYHKSYEESSVYMIIIPKTAQSKAVECGGYVTTDALGITVAYVEPGDQIKSSNNIYYEVKSVRNLYFEKAFSHREVDLVELQIQQLTGKTYTASSVEDARYRTRDYLETYLNDAALPNYIVAYAEPEYPLTQIFNGKDVDLIFCIGEPNSEPLIDSDHSTIGYRESVPITPCCINKTNIAGTKLLHQARTELRRIFENYPSGSLRLPISERPETEWLGSTVLYKFTAVLDYERDTD